MLYNMCIREHTSLLTGYTLAGLLKRFYCFYSHTSFIMGGILKVIFLQQKDFPFIIPKKIHCSLFIC